MSTQQFTIFDIPEVMDGLGRYLYWNTLVICLRVNKTWYHNFLPQIWRDVAVFDFDYNHLRFCVFEAGWYQEENEKVENVPKPIRCIQDENEHPEGHHHADEFSHMIRSITAGSHQALAALGPGCVNLEYLVYLEGPGHYIDAWFYSSKEEYLWREERPSAIESEANGIWLGLIERNPRLKVLRMEVMPWTDEGGVLQRKIIGALKRLWRLEEMTLEHNLEVPGWVETLEEHCSSLKTLVVGNTQILPRTVKQ